MSVHHVRLPFHQDIVRAVFARGMDGEQEDFDNLDPIDQDEDARDEWAEKQEAERLLLIEDDDAFPAGALVRYEWGPEPEYGLVSLVNSGGVFVRFDLNGPAKFCISDSLTVLVRP